MALSDINVRWRYTFLFLVLFPVTCIHYLDNPSSLRALDVRDRVDADFVGLTAENLDELELFSGPTLERLRSFSSCFCLELSSDFSKLENNETTFNVSFLTAVAQRSKKL